MVQPQILSGPAARQPGRTALSDAVLTNGYFAGSKTAPMRFRQVRENTQIGRVKSGATARARPDKGDGPLRQQEAVGVVKDPSRRSSL